MSFDSVRYASNRVAAVVIEIDLDRNDSTYDADFLLDPASYGTPKTTDDSRAYLAGSIITHRWSNCQIPGLSTLPLIKNFEDVNTYPSKVKPGESIGDTARFTAKLDGHFITDDNYDIPTAYQDGRQLEGSYFAKLIERNYLKTRPIRVKRGYIENGSFVFTTEHYIVDNYQGPGINGVFNIEGRDVLTLTNFNKNKSPLVTDGVLLSSVNNSVTTISFSSADYVAEYGAISSTGFISIGKELMSYTVATATTMTVVRAQFGTTATEHSINASLQKCDAFESENIIDIIEYYIDKTEIPSTYKDTTNWNALKAGELSTYNLTNAIFKPAEIKKILNELIQIGGLTVWVDVIAQKIKIVASSLLDNPVITLNAQEHYIADTLKTSNKFDKQTTRQFVRWAPLDYSSTEDNNLTRNFRAVDLIEEDAARENSKSEGKDLVFKWLPNTTDGNQVAVNIVQRNVQRFSILPVEYSVEIDSAYVGDLEGGGNFWIGSIFSMVIPLYVANPNGQTKTITLQCTSVSASREPDRYKVTGLAYSANVVSNADYTIPSGSYTDYVLATDTTMAAVIADKGVYDYVVLVSNGCNFGASSTSNAAFRQGTFPSGSTLTLINQGQIIGAGGDGGDGGIVTIEGGCSATNGANGDAGADALDITTDATIDNSLGLIGGGGGGGAGGAGICPGDQNGSGGGGGQGDAAGSGGIVTTEPGTNPGTPGTDGTRNSAGLGGDSNAGDGGTLGVAGGNALTGTATGGAAGKAIEFNGNTVTIEAGNNSAQIKGAAS